MFIEFSASCCAGTAFKHLDLAALSLLSQLCRYIPAMLVSMKFLTSREFSRDVGYAKREARLEDFRGFNELVTARYENIVNFLKPH
jgi:hypothetical protein